MSLHRKSRKSPIRSEEVIFFSNSYRVECKMDFFSHKLRKGGAENIIGFPYRRNPAEYSMVPFRL